MGQSYTPIILGAAPAAGERESIRFSFDAGDLGNFWKLTEHSYVGNDFVNAVLAFLVVTPGRLVWAGGYADPEPCGDNLHHLVGEWTPTRPVVTIDGTPALDVDPYRERGATYGADEVNVEATVAVDRTLRYVINHDRREYADVRASREYEGLAVHPLPLLTAEGNGRGGGDYGLRRKAAGMQYVGLWARNLIQISDGTPDGDYTLVVPDFYEGPSEKAQSGRVA